MCTSPCVFVDHPFEAFRAVKPIQQLADNLKFKGFSFFYMYTLIVAGKHPEDNVKGL